MHVLIILIYFTACGFFARGLFLGDTARLFEVYYMEHGPLTFKGAERSFKAFLNAAITVKIIFGIFVLPSDIIYKLLMKQEFYFRTSLPDDFWVKYFKEEK